MAGHRPRRGTVANARPAAYAGIVADSPGPGAQPACQHSPEGPWSGWSGGSPCGAGTWRRFGRIAVTGRSRRPCAPGRPPGPPRRIPGWRRRRRAMVAR